jgi:hypothetical protein
MGNTIQYRLYYFKELSMKKTRSEEEPDEINELAQIAGLPYPVQVSSELSELLRPNSFLSDLGIQYYDRIKIILELLKGYLVPNKEEGPSETIPKKAVVIPLALAKGPYIREETISIRAELTDDGGEQKLVLTAVL